MVTVTPDTIELVLAVFQPTVAIDRTVVPGVRSVTITRYTPSVVIEELPNVPIRVVLGTATLRTTASNRPEDTSGLPPTVSTPRTVTPGVTALTVLVPFPGPTVSTPRTATPGTTALTTTSYPPGGYTVFPGTVALTATSYAPTIAHTVVPETTQLLLDPQFPDVLIVDKEGGGSDSVASNYSGRVTTDYFIETSYSMTFPRFREPYTGEYASLLALGEELAGPLASGGVAPSFPVGTDNYDAVVAEETSSGVDWFNKVHFLDRQVYNFGLVLSQKTDDYEVFNSWRQNVTFTALVNNIGSSVTLPNLPTQPSTVTAFTSFLDPVSTHASGANKNKTRLNLVVSKDGPPTFNNTIEWEFSTGDVATARLIGSRLSIIPAIYESDFEETWEFISNTIAVDDGTEQVLSLVGYPVQSFSVRFALDSDDRQRMQLLLMGALPRLLAFPVWHEDISTTALASVGATSVAVSATTDVDYRVGGFAMLWSSATAYDVVELSSVSTNSLDFSNTPILGSYASGTRVVPLRLGYIVGDVPNARSLVNLDTYMMQFRVTDNETGMFAGSTTGWSTYSSKVLLDDPNYMDLTMETLSTTRVRVIDNATGVVEYVPLQEKSRRNSNKGFSIRSRSELMKVKKLLLALRGPQISFRLPTFAEDVTVVADLTLNSTTMDIRHIGYTKYSQSREPRKVFRITFTNGTSLVRVVQSSVEVSTAVERLTLDTTWPSTRTAAQVRRVEFYEPVRFDTEQFTFRFKRTGKASLVAPVKTLVP